MRKKFKIMYPADYHDPEKAGKPFFPGDNKFIVMTNGGVFHIIDDSDYYLSIRKLSNVLYSYDVVWK